MSDKTNQQSLALRADQCVKCGVCLPHCPTFAVRKDEIESPRGRISLIQGLVAGKLQNTETVRQHLDQCLSCGRCETACPANVPFAQLMDDTRYEYATTPASGLWRRRMAARILSSSWLSTIAATTARAAQKLRLHRVFSTKSWPGRMLAWLPVRHARKIPQFTQDDTNTALLFSGCVATRFESAAVAGALDVGRHLGLQLVIPDQHLCCGALYQHMGDKNRAQTLINKSVSVLEDKQDVPVAVLPSGCGKGLSENLAASDSAEARNLRKRLVDLCELFEDAASRNPAIGFRKSDTRVALYFPCSSTVSQRNALRTLLARVPGTEIIILQEGYGCCGASGDHMISDAEGADVFATPIIDEIVAQAPHTVLTVNPGCAWHLRANLRSIKAHIPVLHPVEWLASCL